MNQIKNKANLISYVPIAIVVSLFVVILVAILILWPKLQEIKAVQEQIRDKEVELQITQEHLLNLAEYKTKIAEHQEEISKIKTALPDNPSIPCLFNFLQKASAESGLILTEVGPFTILPFQDSVAGEVDVQKTDIKETVFNIEVFGPYFSFKNFLSVLERTARLIKVENISFSFDNAEEDAEEGVERGFTFNLMIKAFSH